MKTVTVETLTDAMETAQSGMDVDTTAAGYVRMVYDALPAPPLAEDVQAAVDWFETEARYAPTNETREGHASTIITALHAATAQCERWKQYTAGLEKSIIEALLERNQANATIAALREALRDTRRSVGALGADIGHVRLALLLDGYLALPVPPGAECLQRLAALVEDEKAVASLIADVWRQGIPDTDGGDAAFAGADLQLAHYLLAAIKAKVEEA